MFLGYDNHYNGYCCYNLSQKQIVVSRHALFDECFFPFALSRCLTLTPLAPTITPPSLLFPISINSILNHIYDSSGHVPQIQPVPVSTSSPSTAACLSNSSDSSLSLDTIQKILTPPVIPSSSNSLPIHSHLMITRSWTGYLKPKQQFSLLHNTNIVAIPLSFSEAAKNPNWHTTMKDDIYALHKQETWALVSCPSTVSVLGS